MILATWPKLSVLQLIIDLLLLCLYTGSWQTPCVTALGSSIYCYFRRLRSFELFGWEWNQVWYITRFLCGAVSQLLTSELQEALSVFCLNTDWQVELFPNTDQNCNRQQKKYINATILCLEQSNYKAKLLRDEEGKQKWCFSPLKLLQPRLPPSWFLLDASYSALCSRFTCLIFYHFTQSSVFSSLYSENQSQAVFSVQPNISSSPSSHWSTVYMQWVEIKFSFILVRCLEDVQEKL